MNGWVKNFIDKRFSKTRISRLRRDDSYSSSSARAARRPRRRCTLVYKLGLQTTVHKRAHSSREPSFRRDVDLLRTCRRRRDVANKVSTDASMLLRNDP